MSVLISSEFTIFFFHKSIVILCRLVSPTLTLVASTLAGRLWKHNSIFAIIVQTKELSNPNLSPKMRNCTAGWSYRATQYSNKNGKWKMKDKKARYCFK